MAEAVPSRAEMPPWVRGLLIRVVITFLLTLAGLWLIRRLSGLLINLLISLFLSFALEPAVQFLVRRRWKRGLATGVVFLIAFLATVGFFWVMLPPILRQAGTVFEEAPAYVERWGERLAELFGMEFSFESLAQRVGGLGDLVSRYAATVTGQVAGVATAFGRFAINVLSVGLFTFYLLADGPRLRRKLFSVFPPERQRELVRIWELAIEKTGGYVYSRLVLAAASAVFTAIALTIIGVPEAVALGIWVGVISQFIPAVGTYIASVVPLFIAFLDEPVKALWVLIVLVAYQQIENLLLAPRLTARTMALHPAVGFGAAVAGISTLGALGAVIALPTAAIVQAFIAAYLEEHPVETSVLTSDGPRPNKREAKRDGNGD